MKPQNIVYDMRKKRTNFIDFGLMKKRSGIIDKSKESMYGYAAFHWSYPLDNGFLERNYYEYYKNLSSADKDKFEEKLIATFLVHESNDRDNDPNGKGIQDLYPNISLEVSHPSSFDVFFSYIDPDGLVDKSEKVRYVMSFINSFRRHVETSTYERFLSNAVNYLDIFGLGFSLQYALNRMAKYTSGVSHSFYAQLSELLKTMYSYDLDNRNYSTSDLLTSYESILESSNILSRMNKQIVGHKIVDAHNGHREEEVFQNKAKLSPELRAFANEDLQSKSVEEMKRENKLLRKKKRKVTKGRRRRQKAMRRRTKKVRH